MAICFQIGAAGAVGRLPIRPKLHHAGTSSHLYAYAIVQEAVPLDRLSVARTAQNQPFVFLAHHHPTFDFVPYFLRSLRLAHRTFRFASVWPIAHLDPRPRTG